MALDSEIRQAIIEAAPGDPRQIAAELSRRFKKVIPSALVVQIRGTLARAENVERARERASETLDGNLDIMADMKVDLLATFKDESLPMKLRLDASKELRQWIQAETSSAGIQDASTNTLFVIESEWDMRGEE